MKFRTVLFAVTLVVCSATSNASYADNEDTKLVSSLRDEVQTLKSLIADLTMENRNLRELVDRLTLQNAHFLENTASSCTDRKSAMARKLDALKSLGFEDSHPDIINVSKQLGEVENQCADEPSALDTCVKRLTQLQSKHDQLKSLGYIERHPDIVNISRQITAVKNECQASGG